MAVDYFLRDGARVVPELFAAWEAAVDAHYEFFMSLDLEKIRMLKTWKASGLLLSQMQQRKPLGMLSTNIVLSKLTLKIKPSGGLARPHPWCRLCYSLWGCCGGCLEPLLKRLVIAALKHVLCEKSAAQFATCFPPLHTAALRHTAPAAQALALALAFAPRLVVLLQVLALQLALKPAGRVFCSR